MDLVINLKGFFIINLKIGTFMFFFLHKNNYELEM